MFSLRCVAVPTALALLCAPVAAQAQSCSMLRVERSQVARDFLDIAAEYPRTHAMLAICFSDNRQTQQQMNSCANSALETACFFMGRADCNNLMSRWRTSTSEMYRIDQAIRRQGCPS